MVHNWETISLIYFMFQVIWKILEGSYFDPPLGPPSTLAVFLPSSGQDPAPVGLSLALFSAQLSKLEPELGTAQPQLVLLLLVGASVT